ncbi:hypothetical protein AB0J14_04360 [Micromonospora arborensis]|uniref:hypothetical protein n=1 Tax=Micromonospora arborensis TaxID=2116518 RepID=UPI00340EB45B
MTHYHRRWRECTDYSGCRDRGVEGKVADQLISFGPLTGCFELAAALMAHYEVDPDAHPAVLFELEQAIGEAMLDTGRDILREHRIAYPGFDPTAEAVAS